MKIFRGVYFILVLFTLSCVIFNDQSNSEKTIVLPTGEYNNGIKTPITTMITPTQNINLNTITPTDIILFVRHLVMKIL